MNKRRHTITSAALLLGLFAIQTAPHQAHACSDFNYPHHLTAEQIKKYSEIHVVKVEALEPLGDEALITDPFRSQLKVVEHLRGKRSNGTKMVVPTSTDEETTGCPIELKTNMTYLLFFENSTGAVKIARFGSPYLESTNPKFDTYVQDIKKIVRSRK